MSEMQVLDPTGHLTVRWDASSPQDVEHARKLFEESVAKGYSAFRKGKRGSRGARVTTFDPQAEKLILVPQLVGG